ncbi:MarR family winged helix-turn-helix transcriptional regulator [Smaragdicoccus niigatensis]|nr:MarR family transcriptional regulator [Smaragdicoccus niigatensis]
MTETRWLDDEEMLAWLALASLFIKLPAALDRQLQRDAGLSHFEYQVLAGLSQAPDWTLRMSDLAKFTEGQLPRLSQVAARLEKRGWLTRMADPTDGRFTLGTLTEAGMAKLVETAPSHVSTVRRLVFDSLSPEQVGQLRDIARHIVDAVEGD